MERPQDRATGLWPHSFGFHNAAMSSGVLDAMQRLQSEAVDEAAAGFRFFGLERHSTFVIAAARRVRIEPESDEMEAELDRRYDEIGSDDDIFVQRFQEAFADDQSAFARLV